MRGRRGEGPGPCPHAPVPACANQMDTYLVPILTIDASRHSIRHDSPLLESIQLTVTSPRIFPKHPAPSPSPSSLHCLHLIACPPCSPYCVGRTRASNPSIPAVGSLPILCDRRDITSQASYGNGLSDIAPHHPRQTSPPQRPARQPASEHCYPCPVVEAQCHNRQADSTQ